jgi:acetamidase/formamidase
VIHELPLERANLHGHSSRELPPVLTVDPGDSVRIEGDGEVSGTAIDDAWS